MQERITEELIEQTYLFCYKRLGNPEDARDLAQDILCEALQGLADGRKIYQFQSWYWRLARNRYAVLVNRRNCQPTECPIEDYMEYLCSPSDSVEDEMVLEEKLSRMHAAVSRLSKLHREILIQYYIKEQPISVIARNLEVPVGTVKRRLFDARHMVRERMEKMQNVTEMSYAPHELELWMSQGIAGIQSFQDLLGRQLLVCCYQQPQSANELSDRIQVAPLYIEDKLLAMEQAGVMKRVGSHKYLTNFIIFSKNRVTEMLRDIDPVYMEISEKVYLLVKENWASVLEIGFYGSEWPAPYLNYSILPLAMSRFGDCCVQMYHKSPRWKEFEPVQTDSFHYSSTRIMGQVMPAEEKPIDYQIHAVEGRFKCKRIETVSGRSFLISDSYCSVPFPEERMERIHGNNVDLLYELALNPERELTEKEKAAVSGLLEQKLVQKRDKGGCTGYYPQMVIMEREQFKKLTRLFYSLFRPLAEEYFEVLSQRIDKYLLPQVRKDLLEQYYNYVIEIFLSPATNMMWWCKENGVLGLPEDTEHSMAGVSVQHKSRDVFTPFMEKERT